MAEQLVGNTEPSRKAFDEHLYEDFLPYGSLESFTFLDGDKNYRERQKEEFLAGHIHNPRLDYPRIDLAELDALESEVLAQKKNLLANESNSTVRQAYRWRMNTTLAEFRMLRAAGTGDMRRFGKYSEFVYGKPSPEIFAYTVNRIREQAMDAVTSDNPELRACAESILQMLPSQREPDVIKLPDEQTVMNAHEQVIEEFPDLISVSENQQEMSAQEIKEAFEDALKKLGAEGWQMLIDTSGRSGIYINQAKKQGGVPEGRTASFEKVAALKLHEIYSHVGRRLNGERSRLKLLGIGLDRYDRGEEGVTTVREQALANSVEDFRGLERHLAISLALGLDGHARDFRDVYEVMEKYCRFNALIDGKPGHEAKEQAERKAWNGCVRVFRGTDCATPGVCFTKDIIYREGNIAVWALVGQDFSEMRKFSLGKYDPTNLRHIWILEQLGITEDDLDGLEK